MMEKVKVAYSWSAGIKCKYLAPTNTKGSRVKVQRASDHRQGDFTVTLDWSHELTTEQNYIEAFKAFIAETGWTGSYIGSWVQDGMVFVKIPKGGMK